MYAPPVPSGRGSRKRSRTWARVVFPEPEVPTTAIRRPSSRVRSTPHERVAPLPLVAGPQSFQPQRERRGGRGGGGGGLAYGCGRVQHLLHPFGALADPLAVLDGERHPHDRLERGHRGEHHHRHGDAVQPSVRDSPRGDQGGHRDGQSGDQRGQPVPERGGGRGAGGDPGEDRVGLPGLGGTGGQGARDGQFGGSGEQVRDPGGEHPAGRGEPALGAPGDRAGQQRYPGTGGEQSHGEHGTGLGQQPGGEADGSGGDGEGGTGREQPAQPVVLEGVDIGHQPGQQIPAPGGAQSGGGEPFEAPVDGDPGVAEHPQHRVVRDQPFRVAEAGPSDAEGAGGRDGHHQIEHGRLLGGPRDQISGGRHQADRAAEGEAAEQQGQGEPSPPGSGHVPDPAQRGPLPGPGPGTAVRPGVSVPDRRVPVPFRGLRAHEVHGVRRVAGPLAVPVLVALRLEQLVTEGRAVVGQFGDQVAAGGPPARAVVRGDGDPGGTGGACRTSLGRDRPLGHREGHHPVGHGQQRRAVHHEQHGPADGQSPYRLDHIGLGVPVERGRGFVQQQHGPVREEGPREGESLPLSGGQSGPVLPEQGVGPVGQRVHELQCSGVAEGPADGGVVGVGPGEADVLRDGTRVQMGALGHPCHLLVPGLPGDAGELRPADPYPAPLRAYEAQGGGDQGRLARAARSDECDGLPRSYLEGHPGHGVVVASRVPDADLVEAQSERLTGGKDTRAVRGDLGLQDLEDLLRRRESLGRRVVLRAHLPDRQIRLGRQDQDHQPDGEVHPAVDQPHPDGDGDERDRQGREQFQGERRDEGDPQGAHGGAPVVAGDPADRLGLGLGPAEDLERGESGDHIEEVSGEPGQHPPLTVHPGLGRPADEDHEDRDQRKGARDDGGGDPVLGDDPYEHRDGYDHREPQLGEIAGEVVVQGVDAPGGEGDQ